MTMPSLLHREQLVSLADAAAWVRSRSGRKTHVSTLYRWALRGCRGRKLETVLIGRERMTSREALNRFFEERPEPLPVPVPAVQPAAAPPASVNREAVARDVEQLHQRLFGKKAKAS